jgi:carbamoyltransferase
LQETDFEDIYIQPAAGDGGGALGAALYVWHCALGNKKRFVMDHAYWGQGYEESEVSSAIKSAGIQSRYIDDSSELVNIAVDRMENGQVISWFQGRFEYGPRALGNRSILADPRSAAMKDVVNTKIKFREPFRPFAPAVTVEAASQYFALPQTEGLHMPTRFMLFVVPVHQNQQDKIPAVSHEGTSRVQLVHQDVSPVFHQLLDRFGEATGVPVLLNTSFNVRGMPIVNTPQDAISTFYNTDIDALFMGNFLIEKS